MPEIPSRFTSRRQRGFTLIEAAVSLFVTVIVLLGVLALFDFSNKLSRVQTNVADMQQSMRVAQADAVRLIRMAGRGGLPLPPPPAAGQPWNVDWAVAVRNNVADGATIGGAGTPQIVPGTDVLTVRGVFGSIYQVNTSAPGTFTLNADKTGTIKILSTTPTGIPQDLQALKDAITGNRPVALILVSPLNSTVWTLVALNPAGSSSSPSQVVAAFSFAGAYGQFSSSGAGVYPPDLTTASLVGILEERRFYVRREFAVAGDQTSDLAPKLSEARTYPGTDTPEAGNAENWRLDIADNVFDLQVALGFSAGVGTGCGALPADAINCETADGQNDDWVYNGEPNPNATAFANSDLLYVRLNTLARTDRREHDYLAPLLARMEDNRYVNSPFNTNTERMYRRRVLRTLIDLRNL
jgi:type II secretory pathway pseudopilin PulG